MATILPSQPVIGLQIGALVTIHQRDVSSVFSEDELFGIHNRTTNSIITVAIVFDANRLTAIQNHKKILSFEITAPDYSVIIRQELERINNRTIWKRNDPLDWFFEDFRPWFEYELFLDVILFEYTDITTKFILGQTIQGRDIPGIIISTDNMESNKPGFYIQAMVHSNEWLANAATAYILKAICEGYGQDDYINYILENINIFIVPVINIDGYIYSWIGASERNWRKNRRDNGGGTFGVDLNRNYGPLMNPKDGEPFWCTVGASNNPASNNYCGTGPFSEPETEAISRFISNGIYNIKAAVDMHTTGPYILWPWAYTVTPLPNPYYEEYFMLGTNMQGAAFDVDGQNYLSIQSGTWYETSGDFCDWIVLDSGGEMYEMLGFTFEGRSIGSGNPPIVVAGQEQLAALLVLAQHLIS
eukprot:239463_1